MIFARGCRAPDGRRWWRVRGGREERIWITSASLSVYWHTDFDWRAQEAALSRFSHERVPASGLSFHQIHERAAHPDALPLVLLHGWPDSFLRYTKVLPLLGDFPSGCAFTSRLWLLGATDEPGLELASGWPTPSPNR